MAQSKADTADGDDDYDCCDDTSVRRCDDHLTNRLDCPGGHESLTVHSSKSRDSCTLAVTLPSGRLSTARGLGTTTANASGVATWTWLIGSTTGAGTARVSVSCGAGTVAGTFTIT